MKLGGSASTKSSALLAWVPADAVAEYLGNYRTADGQPINLEKVLDWLDESGRIKEVRDPLSLREIMAEVIDQSDFRPAFADDGKTETKPHTVSLLIRIVGAG